MAAAVAPLDQNVSTLVDSQLGQIVTEAADIWMRALGPNASRLAMLNGITIEVGDLPDNMIGATVGDMIVIDPTAAGWGWFVDATPGDNSEFATRLNDSAILANGDSPAAGRMDLLSTVLHEMGNVMGFAEDLGEDVTGMVLSAGERRLPVADAPIPVFPGAAATISAPESAGPITLNIGTPSIKWTNAATPPRVDATAQSPAWMSDFVTNLGQDQDGLKPNSGMKIKAGPGRS